MEDENKIEASAETPNCAPIDETANCQQPETSKQSQPEVKSFRKNGRNRSGAVRSQSKGGESTSVEGCGEIANPAEFKEKLSGSNIAGYPEGQGYDDHRRERDARSERDERGERKFRDRGERGERSERRGRSFRRDGFASNEDVSAVAEKPADENIEAPTPENEQSEDASKGPFFESKTPDSNKVVEVSLSDKRGVKSHSNPAEQGIVSYSAEDDNCPISLFSRIKAIIKSIFGRKSSAKKPYNKKGGKKPWNNNRDGGKYYHSGHRHGGKGNYNKRRYNDRRPNNNGGNAS